ncbi:MAG: sugar phosphate nucleotidyltransferase [Candidatus Sumerlaeota bacterium]|nr:sugar phosphate nucleotidyltransferase [Candidatus Sumerlaeota bacterium]
MQNAAALVLAGGHNEGFGVLTSKRAKAALPYAGHYRLIDFTLSNLSDSGIDQVGLIIQYLPGSLIDHVGTGQAWDYFGVQRQLKIMPPFVGVGDTFWYKGSADALARNLGFVRPLETQDVIVCSAEHVCRIDFSEVVAFHRSRGADLTIVAKKVPPEQESKRYGRVIFDSKSGRVARFMEKPADPITAWISVGIYVFRGEILARALGQPNGQSAPVSLPKDVIEPLAGKMRSYVHVFDGTWDYLADLGAYYQSHRQLLAGDEGLRSAVLEARTNLLDRDLSARAPAWFGPESAISGSIVSPGCRVFGRVINSSLSPGVFVGPGAEVCDSILFHDCRVEPGASLHRVVADKDALFGAGCQVGWSEPSNGPNPQLPESAQNLAVIGKHGRIGAGARLPLGVQVYPRAAVEASSPALARGVLNLTEEAQPEEKNGDWLASPPEDLRHSLR